MGKNGEGEQSQSLGIPLIQYLVTSPSYGPSASLPFFFLLLAIHLF